MFPLVLALLPWLVLALVVYLLLTEPPRELDPASWKSSSLFLVARVPLRACVRRQGVLSPGSPWVVEGGKAKLDKDTKDILSAVCRGWKFDADTFASYCRACGVSPPSNSGSSTSEPFLYPETLFLRHMISIVTSSSFPLSPLGLIHLRQVVETRCALSDLLSTRCDLQCVVSDIRATDRGFEVDMKCDVYDASSGDARTPLWSGVTTLLSRNKATIEKQKSDQLLIASQPFLGEIGKCLDVAEDTGFRYAAATGDYNPHHLYPAMARLLGYKQPITHGMWTLAKVLATIQAGIQPPLAIYPPIVMKATFKKPLSIPAKCSILYTIPSKDHEVRFEVRDTEGTTLHVAGTIVYTRL